MTMSGVKRPHRHQKITQINDNYLKKQSVDKNFTKNAVKKQDIYISFKNLWGHLQSATTQKLNSSEKVVSYRPTNVKLN